MMPESTRDDDLRMYTVKQVAEPRSGTGGKRSPTPSGVVPALTASLRSANRSGPSARR